MDISKYTQRYADFRYTGRLRQYTWQSYIGNGVHVACALGALLNVHDLKEAAVCASDLLPKWMIETTVVYFDKRYPTKDFHIQWADALYLPGGLIDRANQLSKTRRKKFYAAARREILRRFNCERSLKYPDSKTIVSVHEGAWHEVYPDPELAAGTIIHVLDELLTAAGV